MYTVQLDILRTILESTCIADVKVVNALHELKTQIKNRGQWYSILHLTWSEIPAENLTDKLKLVSSLLLD
jgi:hypothetical protein